MMTEFKLLRVFYIRHLCVYVMKELSTGASFDSILHKVLYNKYGRKQYYFFMFDVFGEQIIYIDDIGNEIEIRLQCLS